MTATRLHPDPRVAYFALRFPSRSKEGVVYDCALLVDKTWSCDCWPFLKKDTCQHVVAARRILRALRSVVKFNLRRGK